jgi:hypothetical protein
MKKEDLAELKKIFEKQQKEKDKKKKIILHQKTKKIKKTKIIKKIQTFIKIFI